MHRILPFALAAALLACRAPEPDTGVRGVYDDRIVLGTYGPLTGPAASWGVSLHAMKAYFEHLNTSGGIHGRRIELLLRDDQYNSAQTPTVVRELVEQAGVFAIVGGVGTANGRTVARYLERQGVPFYTPASGSTFFSDPVRPHVYTVYTPYALEGRLIGEMITGRLGHRRVGVLHQDDDFGTSGADGLTRAVEAGGGQVVVRVTCLPTDTDLTGQVSRIAAATPDVLVLYTAPRQGALAALQLTARGAKPPLVTSFVLADKIMFELAGTDAWEGTIAATPYRLADDPHPSVARYREVMGRHGSGLPVGAFTLAGFAWMQPFAGALEMAGPDLTVEKLYAAFQRMKDWDESGPHWPPGNLTGPITFGPKDHRGNEQVFFVRATKGRWTKLTSWVSIGKTTGRSDPVQEER